jgi:hypothetical protein
MLVLRPHRTRKIRVVTRIRVTNQRAKTRVEDVEDVEDVGDTTVDTVYLKEGKVAEENVTRSHLTKRTILRTLGLSTSIILRITQRIVLAIINVPSTGRRVITRQTVGDIRSIS